MLLIITILVLTVGIIWGIKTVWDLAPFTVVTVASIALIVMVILMSVNYIGADGFVAASKQRYESLTYQYENDFYENDNDLGKYELVSKIQEWNEDLARRKKYQNNFWIGVFIPDIYDQFQFIELGK